MNDGTFETGFVVKTVEQRTSVEGETSKRDVIPVVQALEQKLDESPLDESWRIEWAELTLPMDCKFNPKMKLHRQYVEQFYEAGHYDVYSTDVCIVISKPKAVIEEPNEVKQKMSFGQKIKNFVKNNWVWMVIIAVSAVLIADMIIRGDNSVIVVVGDWMMNLLFGL